MGPILEAQAHVAQIEARCLLPAGEPPVVAEQEHTVEERGIVGHRDPGLTAVHGLGTLEAEAAHVAPRAHGPVAVAGSVSVGAILHDGQAVAAG